nr:MAG TPA: hypothetical protein [Caudoviricetes sp.]
MITQKRITYLFAISHKKRNGNYVCNPSKVSPHLHLVI